MAFPSRLNADSTRPTPHLTEAPRPVPIDWASRISFSKRRASFRGYLAPLWLQYCMAPSAGADPDDVNDVSSLPEPHGPDGAMADRGCVGAPISQSRTARRVRQI